MADKYPSQINRVIFHMSPDHRDIANRLAVEWSGETGHKWSAKAVVESLLDLANEGEIEPVSGAKKVK
jgi:hypothetical protein